MKKPILVVAIALFASIAMLPSNVHVYADDDHDDHDRLVCYLWDIFPDERFKLNVKEHSPLSNRRETRNFGHARQTAFSVHGKHVVFDTMATVEGTVVTAAKTSATTGPRGSHMGLHSKFVRGDGVSDFARPLTVECTSDEVSPTPKTWSCQSRNDFDIYHGFSNLIRVDERKDPACSIFEDGEFGEFGTNAITVDVLKGSSVSKQ
jgi:hypothetical protein